MKTHKKAKLALARETVVELRPQVLAAIHGGAGNQDPSALSCLRWCGTTPPRGEGAE